MMYNIEMKNLNTNYFVFKTTQKITKTADLSNTELSTCKNYKKL
jgi:hypothetical protein